MKEKLEILKKYARIITKYAFYAFIAITIIDLTILCCLRGSEFRTIGYTISSYAFRLFFALVVFWYWYVIVKIYQTIIKTNKGWRERILRFCVAALILCPMLCFGLVATFYISFRIYADGDYEKCMEECVKEDLSNFSECTNNTCDFVL